MLNLLDLPTIALVREVAQARKTPAILVGGAVRDALLDMPAHDFDFAVQGKDNTISLARAVANRLGGAFYIMDDERGTARVILGAEADRPEPLILDFAVCRGNTWTDDLLARDFSINAIALDLASGQIMDPAHGRADLSNRLIRQVTPHAISDDPVRALRAIRLARALSSTLETATVTAIHAAAASLHRPSPERVRDEVMKTLAHARASRAVRQWDELGLLAQIFPEIEPMRTCEQSPPHHFKVLEHTFVVLDYLDEIIANLQYIDSAPAWLEGLRISPSHRQALASQLSAVTTNERLRSAVFRLAALLHDAAKPATRSVDDKGSIHFYQHEEAGAELAAARANALKLSSDEVDQVRVTVRHHMRPNQMSREAIKQSSRPTPRAIYRFMRSTGQCAPEIALFCIADGMGKAGAATPLADAQRRASIASLLIERYYEQFSAAAAPKPLITGKDVITLGVKPGPEIGRILDAVREAQMVGEISTSEEALALARSLQSTVQ
jgi:tRNA nucleotidyltransferase/poly(A) polymerase